MTFVFLKSATDVIPTIDRDYSEWHKGRCDFSLWYLDIHQPDLLAYLAYLREEFQDLLLIPITRQFHITLFICGFLTAKKSASDDFSMESLQWQAQQLKQAKYPKFILKTAMLNSFTTALFLEVDDPEQHLIRIRQYLQGESDEIAALEYCPHITLGLYRTEICSDIVLKRMENIQQRSFEFNIDYLSFGTYQAQILQGPLTQRVQIELEDL